MRKLICWTSGKEIIQDKFLHCTACGVNYSQDCLQNLNFSIAEEGISRPETETYYHLCFLPNQFAPWLDLGKMASPIPFATYLLQLLKEYPQKSTNKIPKVYYLCNSCHVDIEFRIADAELCQILLNAQKNHQKEVFLEQDKIQRFESIEFIKILSKGMQSQFYDLVKINLDAQLGIINMVCGNNWSIQKAETGMKLHNQGL